MLSDGDGRDLEKIRSDVVRFAIGTLDGRSTAISYRRCKGDSPLAV
jgi:hypothetical protein